MQYQSITRPPAGKPIAIEIDGEPLGIVVRSEEGYRFLAVRYQAFPLDGRIFQSIEEARATIGAAINVEAEP
jgi:hypothetical protein